MAGIEPKCQSVYEEAALLEVVLTIVKKYSVTYSFSPSSLSKHLYWSELARSWLQASFSELKDESLAVCWPHLVAMHHEVVCGDQGFEDHNPASVASPLKQRVSHLWDVHVRLLGGLDQIWGAQRTNGRLDDVSILANSSPLKIKQNKRPFQEWWKNTDDYIFNTKACWIRGHMIILDLASHASHSHEAEINTTNKKIPAWQRSSTPTSNLV